MPESSTISLNGLSRSKLKKLRRLNLIPEDQIDNLVPLAQIQKGPLLNRYNHIKPKTINQSKVFKAFDQGRHLLLHGYAGTGKTFISLGIALNEVLNKQTFEKIILIRSTVPTRDMGFMPGKKSDKESHYETPYVSIVNKLFGNGNAYANIKGKGIINFESTSYLRGLTFENAIVIFDECQNGTFHELDTVMTRLGDNSRVIFSGDFRQSDLRFKDEKEGLINFISIIEKMPQFAKIEMGIDDIVRSGMVRDYIITRTELGF